MPRVKRLLLAERSNRAPGSGSDRKILHSSTRTRLDSLYAEWESAFTVRNIWRDKEDGRDPHERVEAIIAETNPDLIVALGVTVCQALDIPYETPWLSSVYAHGVPALKYPHPSGRSRVWNDPDFTELAAEAFAQAAEGAPSDLIPEPATENEHPCVRASLSAADRLPCKMTTKFFKSYDEWSAVCDCGWSCSFAGKKDKTPDELQNQIDFHLN